MTWPSWVLVIRLTGLRRSSGKPRLRRRRIVALVLALVAAPAVLPKIVHPVRVDVVAAPDLAPVVAEAPRAPAQLALVVPVVSVATLQAAQTANSVSARTNWPQRQRSAGSCGHCHFWRLISAAHPSYLHCRSRFSLHAIRGYSSGVANGRDTGSATRC